MTSSEERFRPYRWMRAIGRSELPKRCRDVLRMLAVEMRPGEPHVQMTQSEMLDLMGMTDDKSLKTSLDECVDSGWLIIDRSCRPYAYRAVWPADEVGVTPTSTSGKPRTEIGETPKSEGNEFGVTPKSDNPDIGETPNSSRGNPDIDIGVTPTSSSSIERPESFGEAGPAGARPPAHEGEKSPAEKLRDLLAFWDRPISERQAESLIEKMEPYHPNPIAYVEARIDEGILGRIETNRLLLRVLAEDAERDAVHRPPTVDAEPRTAARRTDTDDETDQATEDTPDPPGPPLDDYEHPAEWATALEDLRGRISSANYRRWFEPLRAEATESGLVLWADDEFDALWLRQEWLDVLEELVDVAAIRPDQRGAA